MARKRSSASQEAKLAMECVTWDHVLRDASLDENIVLTAAIKGEDTNSDFLKGFLKLNSKNPVILKFFLSNLSVEEDHQDKIMAALMKIRKEGIGYKRRCTENVRISPSALGDLTRWMQNQKSLQLSCHLPPATKMHALHVSLRVKAFGNFLDAMNRPGPIESKFMNFACALILACSKVHHTEESLIRKVKPIIRQLVEGMDVEVDKMSSDEVDGVTAATSDTTVMLNKDGQQIALVTWEFKRDIAGVKSNPDIQNMGYFLRFQKKWQRQSAPLLMVSLSGFSHMQVFGAAWNGDDCCIDPLSQPLSTLFVPSDPIETTQKVAVLLRAIHGAVVDLKQHYECVDSNRHPYYMHENELKHVKNLLGKERVFLGEREGQQVVVKFTRSYGLEAHKILAKNQLAPAIISHETLPGGWIVVIMEYVEGPQLPESITEVTKASLNNALQILHDAEFVHGDLRPQNIVMTKKGGVCILDFDWAGKVGEVYYPSDINLDESCGWHSDVDRSGLIKFEHDRYQIQKIQ